MRLKSAWQHILKPSRSLLVHVCVCNLSGVLFSEWLSISLFNLLQAADYTSVGQLDPQLNCFICCSAECDEQTVYAVQYSGQNQTGTMVVLL